MPELLLEPQFPKARGAFALDAGWSLEPRQIVGRKTAAVQLQRAGVERAAVPAEGARRVELERHRGQAVILEAAPDAARQVAERFAALGYRQRRSVILQPRAHPAHVVQQRLLFPQANQRVGGGGRICGLRPSATRTDRAA